MQFNCLSSSVMEGTW